MPYYGLPELCFAGRSNVGKSSLINAITYRKKIASTSSKPGHTKKIFFYSVSNKFILVDLPGYGFANISHKRTQEIAELISIYLNKRKDLRNLILLIDSRHDIKRNDLDFIHLLNDYKIKYQIVLTKADKSSLSQIKKITAETKGLIALNPSLEENITLTSSVSGIGIKELRKNIINQIQKI